MKTIYKMGLSLLLCVGLNYFASAQTPLGTSKQFMGELKKDLSSSTARVSGIDLPVSASQSLGGKINYKQSDAASELLMGEIQDVPGSSFFLKVSESSTEGQVILKETKKAYKYYSDASGSAFVDEVNINSLICIDYENLPSSKQKSEAQVREEATQVSQALLNLQSLPGANGCVLLDFDGYYMPAGNYWNNGNAINAAASGMGDADVQQFWELVSEDYRPFNVNITTSESVFNSYPRTRRMRVVVTPTNTAAPGAGGVAYVGSFIWDNDVPCWVFITSGKSGGDAASHEIGHCFDLQHDGRSNPDEGYFLGIDKSAWAPIMGAGYYRPIVQWSKGEYNYAKNDVPGVLQDDIATIASSKFGVGFRGDDYGNGTSNAANLAYDGSGNITQKNGIITNEADIDFFKFTTGGGTININARTVSRDGNLDIIIRLYNASGTQIGSANKTTAAFISDNNYSVFQEALHATLTTNVAAGTYYVSIDGTGANDPGYGGYSAYGSIGSYSITGTIPPGNVANSDGFAVVYKDCAFGGYAIGLNEGNYTTADLTSKGILNDDISSIKVKQGFKVIAYVDDNFSGASYTWTGDDDCVVNEGFNDIISSLKVVPNGVGGKNGIYTVQNRFSGLFLDVPNAASDNLLQWQQWTYNGSEAQQFKLTELGSGVYQVMNIASSKYMDVQGISQDNGAPVIQYPYMGSANQQWILVASDGGYYKLIARHTAKVMEIGGWSTVAGGKTQQWTNDNQTSGQWKLNTISPVIGNGNGLIGSYFNGMNFETAVLNRKDATVNFNWGSGSPATNVHADQFSVRWTGQVQPKYTGKYTFHINSDNGRRLWVNGQLIIDKWIDDWNVEYTGTITLTAGQKYDIKMEYFENYGGAGAKLEWSSALQGKEVIPTSQLYSPAVTNPGGNNVPPSVSIASPSNNASFNAPASFTITANASDSDGSITKVEFFNGSSKLGEDATAPYSYGWSNVSAGTYTITVKATDNNGAVTTSGAIAVTVKTVTPTDNCTGLSTYADNGGYAAGSKVKNVGRQYECKEWPYSGWCNGAAWAYAPGTGTYWTDAWYDRGSCTPTTGGAVSVTNGLTLSPNPAQDVLNLSSSYNMNGGMILVVDVTGKTVLQTQAANSIDTSKLDAGIYTLIFITGDQQKVTERFIKIN